VFGAHSFNLFLFQGKNANDVRGNFFANFVLVSKKVSKSFKLLPESANVFLPHEKSRKGFFKTFSKLFISPRFSLITFVQISWLKCQEAGFPSLAFMSI
jgi:hypothetical protein